MTGTPQGGGTAPFSGVVTKSGTGESATATEGAYTGRYKMDVVPYITGIKTELSVGNKKHPTVLSRSSLGVYPVRRGTSITVDGFNFVGTDSTVTIGDTEITPSSGTTTNSLVIDIASNSTIMNSDITANINSVESLNNLNKDTATGDYNTEPNGQNNDILTDNRKIYVMDVYKTTEASDKRKLDMAIYQNTINFSVGYQDRFFSIMRNASNGTVGNVNNLRGSYTRYFDNKMAFNADGVPYTVSSCGDTLGVPVTGWDNGPSHFALTRGNRGVNDNEEYGRSDRSSKLYLASNWNGANLNNLDRFQWPDLVVTGNTANTKGYISYYDSTHKLIEFRYFTSNAANTVATNLRDYTAGANPGYGTEGAVRNDLSSNQSFMAIAGADENSPYSAVGVTPNGTTVVSWYDATAGALKLKYNTAAETSYSGYQILTAKNINQNLGTGTISFDISVDGVSKGSISVNVNIADTRRTGNWNNYTYYPGTRTLHELAFQLNEILADGYGAYAEVDPASTTFDVAIRSMQTGTASSISISNFTSNFVSLGNSSTGAGQRWNEVTIDSNSAGQYVAMQTDSKNGIHFAYLDTGNGDLKYAYLSSVNATPITVTVDGYQQVGQYVDLALKETTNGTTTSVTPFISYYSMSNADTKRSVKVAKLVSPIIYTGNTPNSVGVTNGSDDELFTGSWEAVHVPSEGIPVQYRVNIGVTSDGDVYVGYLSDRIFVEYVKVF